MGQKEFTNYKTEKQRWIVLALFMFIAFMTQINWITFAPITDEVASEYNVSPDAVLLLAAVYMIAYLFVNFPATWAIDKYGLKWGTGIGVILTGVFGLLRAFSGDNFGFLMFAQIMTAIGQPFILNSFTKVSINWFPENEKTTATGLGTISILLGVVVGMIATPYLYENQGIDFILWLYGILSLIAMLLYLVIVQNNPKSPPSAAAGTKVFDFRGMMNLFKVRDFNILLILVFIGLGSFNALLSDIDNIFIRFNSNTQAAGLIAATMIFGGILGAGILSTYSDKLHKRKIFLVIAMLTSIPLTVLLDNTDNLNQVLVISFIFGFF
ncbi:MAG: MFS transporter, partial [Candidatus Heimdallarchaeota archaeon]